MNDRFSADDLPRRSASGRGPSPWPVDLAHAKPFRLGGVEVRPASREVVGDDRTETLEPLVMQVLVALFSARGEIVGRDDLIDACWGGRAVTDDAVNRVISRLRALGRHLGAFDVETVTKVGYRLTGQVGDPGSASPKIDRRLLIIGGAAVAGAGALGVGLWRRGSPPEQSTHAQILLQKGMTTLQNNDIIEAPDPGTSLQAIAFLTEATEAAPKSATAWGALAVAYSVRKRAVPLSERPGFDARGRAAAKTALSLDPTEPRAIATLILLEPFYRRWLTAEPATRAAFEKRPDIAMLPALMSNFLGNVGRFKEAARYTKSIDRTKFVIPGVEWRLLIDLWASGDLRAADDQLEVAGKRWPQHARVWRARVSYLLYSGRPAEVLRLLSEPADIPIEINTDFIETLGATAQSLAGQLPAATAVKRNLNYLKRKPAAALDVAEACVALGDKATAFDIFNGYYFGEGRLASLAPQGGDEDRFTSPLFHPSMRPIWSDAAFARLVERIGLEDYWRRSGKQPDFRRT